MQLTKEEWNAVDGKQFQSYLQSQSLLEKVDWTRKIINTKMPLLAIPTPKLKLIAKQIGVGNFNSFLNLNLNHYYENVAINGFLICKIKDFNNFKARLLKYIEDVDNWATCDLLQFGVNDKNKKQFYDLSLQLIKSEKPFARRIGVRIWFKFIQTEYLTKIFDVINNMVEDEYYVNMCVAWFVTECFIKERDKTLEFLKTNKLNQFTINKAISKCRDSFRVSHEDKEMLLSFKK